MRSASSALRLKTVEEASSLEDFSWIEMVGSRIGREEVESSCSWVAMFKIGHRGELRVRFSTMRRCASQLDRRGCG